MLAMTILIVISCSVQVPTPRAKDIKIDTWIHNIGQSFVIRDTFYFELANSFDNKSDAIVQPPIFIPTTGALNGYYNGIYSLGYSCDNKATYDSVYTLRNNQSISQAFLSIINFGAIDSSTSIYCGASFIKAYIELEAIYIGTHIRKIPYPISCEDLKFIQNKVKLNNEHIPLNAFLVLDIVSIELLKNN